MSPAFHPGARPQCHLKPASSGCPGDWEAAISAICWCPQADGYFWIITPNKAVLQWAPINRTFILFNLKFVHNLSELSPHRPDIKVKVRFGWGRRKNEQAHCRSMWKPLFKIITTLDSLYKWLQAKQNYSLPLEATSWNFHYFVQFLRFVVGKARQRPQAHPGFWDSGCEDNWNSFDRI